MRLVAGTNKTIYLGVGGATMLEINSAVKYLKKIVKGKLILMHGIQSFPTKLEDSQISLISYLINKYQLDVGYADHISADEKELSVILPAMAVAAGATVIEKHITDDRGKKGRDYFSSLEFLEFKHFVSLMKNMNVILGSPNDVMLKAQGEYRNLMKRQAVASKNLFAGKVVSSKDFDFKRTGIPGLTYEDVKSMYGKKLKSDKVQDAPITLGDFYE
jgi:N,N'-diacetyllegionaminate synthase